MEMMMTMQMWFEATTEVTLWFKQWKVHSWTWYAVSCIGLFCLCLLQEALARYRAAVARRAKVGAFQSLGESELESSSALPQSASPSWNRTGEQVGMRAYVSLLYGLNIGTSYLLMLAVMTFNVGYFVVIVLGLAVGHFVFYTAAGASPGPVTSEACCPQPS